MSTVERPSRTDLPDHTQLPESDGTFVKNFQEHPQSILLSDSIEPLLKQRFPDNQYTIGQDSGIYWRITEPLVRGAESPDWFLVLGVPPSLKGRPRRSYVLWQELVPPLIILEFVSGDGSEERDRTTMSGKFWVYEQRIRPTYYGIYEVDHRSVEMYQLVGDHFEPMPMNDRGRYPIAGLGVELGIWWGTYQNCHLPWMRWWDEHGEMLPTGHELAEVESKRADREATRAKREANRARREATRAELEATRARREATRAELETTRAERLAAQLRALGIEPEE